ncbi:hypothetical protein G6011_10690 [Alternaria panax]|uniref:RNA-dependent RNA polymerase n=1 Tax=Alternaria panax TaxID=48097 RepID=A0AAD4ICH2_9PLEO|nr:hypothetical protein G6011_10690 [Alternaria panax]
MTGNGGPAASLPGTPRRPGAAIDDLIRSLEKEWKVGLRIRGAEWSPKKSNVDDPPDKIYALVKFLFYRARPDLYDAIEEFKGLAPSLTREERLEALRRILSSRKESLLGSGSRTPKNEPPKSLVTSFSGVKSVPQATNCSLDAQQDERDSYATAIDPGSPTDVDTDDETNQDFETPRSPSRSPSPSPSLSTRPAQTLYQASNHFSLHITRKRLSKSSGHSENSPKLTKTSKGKQAVKSFTSSPIAPPQFKKPTLKMARSFQFVPSGSSSVNTSFSNTAFSSQETAATTNTSFTSHDGVSDFQEMNLLKPRLTRTSSTTMGSLDDRDLYQAMSRSGSEVCEQDIQRDLNENFPQGSSGQSRSTFGSIDEDGLLEASFGVEDRQNKPEETPDGRHGNFKVPPDLNVSDQQARASASTMFLFNGVSNDQGQTSPGMQSPSKMPYEVRNLPNQNLFVEKLPRTLEHMPYHILFICQRLAIEYSVPLQHLVRGMNAYTISSDSETFWRFIEEHHDVPSVKVRESSRLWQAAKRKFDGYTFKGHISFSLKDTGPIVYLTLLPVQADKSCRLQRMFGSDRFLYLLAPVFNSSKTNRFNADQVQQVRSQWQAWLLTEHSFLGRKWRVFHIEDLKKSKTSRRKDVVHDKRIVLFATEGCGIEQPCSVGQMMHQFLPFDANRNQGFCKAFARIELGLSRTIPTLCFDTRQIIHVRDDFATTDPEDIRFNDPKLQWQAFPNNTVMNDGCSIISVGAALVIWQLYKKATGVSGPLPSAFQGRIGGAKGLWMISAESFTKDPQHLKYWIKINRSQWKFHPPLDQSHHHRTFEVSNYSSTPSPSELHISFIPILIDRGIKREVVAGLMKESLDTERSKLLELLPDPVKIYDWVHRNGTKAQTEPSWQGALPISLEEKVKFMLESGFLPTKFPYLARILERFIQTKHILQESKLRVPLAKSAFFYGIADPLGVLKPGEIQVQFSSSFVDEKTDEKYLCLRDIEALVARQPACRRSDIQKVRTVIHPELSHLVDVVVFPCKGRYPLAGKLQGGDYDGDMFWVCWEATLVQPFLNAPAPVQSPNPAEYGIKTRTERLQDIMDTGNPEGVDNFLRKAFEFRNNPSLLGLVTTFAEKQAYSENCIHSSKLEQLYDMHDLLVDASKQGYVLTQADFDGWVRRLPKQLKQPVYKTAMKDCASTKDSTEIEKNRKKLYQYEPEHVIDYIYFDVVRAHNIKTMVQLKSVFSQAIEQDEVLLYPSKRLSEKQSKTIEIEFLALTGKLKEVRSTWNAGLHSDMSTNDHFDTLVNTCYERYRAIQPQNPGDADVRPLMDEYLTPGACLWDTIKASTLYATFQRPEQSTFVLTMAGRELARLKANRSENSRAIVSSIRANMKPKPIKAPIQYEEEDDEDYFETALEEPIL